MMSSWSKWFQLIYIFLHLKLTWSHHVQNVEFESFRKRRGFSTSVDLSNQNRISWKQKTPCNAYMMTSSNGNIFRVTVHLSADFTGQRWIPRKKGQWRVALMFSLICTWINGFVNNREAGDLRYHRAHYDVIVMKIFERTGLILDMHLAIHPTNVQCL